VTDTELLNFLECEFSRPNCNPPDIEYRDESFSEQGRWWVDLGLGYKAVCRAHGEGQTLREAIENCIEAEKRWRLSYSAVTFPTIKARSCVGEL
jgi:hypothetical protein